MSRIRPTWTPANTDQSGAFTIGHRWSSTVAVTVDGAWYYRGIGTNPPTGLTALLYDLATETVLASGTVGAPPEGWSLVPFAAPFAAQSGIDYVTAVETDGRYGFDLSGVEAPITDPDHGVVTIPAGGAAFEFGHVFPGSFWEGMHGSDTEFAPSAAEPSEGTAALGIGLRLAATGGRVSAAMAATGIGLRLQAAGGRASRGSAPLGLGLELAATGARPSLGQAHFVLGLRLAGPVATVIPGTLVAASMGCRLATSSTGSGLSATSVGSVLVATTGAGDA